MGEVHFYHLTRSAPETALASVAGRALERGWRVGVVVADAARADWLDQRLWGMSEEGFLPHGLQGGPHDDLQPILICAGRPPDGRACLLSLDGAEVDVERLREAERACILFDGTDPAAVERARGQWRALTGAGFAAIYWSEEGGRWEKKAEARPDTSAG